MIRTVSTWSGRHVLLIMPLLTVINLGAETVFELNMAAWTFTLLLLFSCNLIYGKDISLGTNCLQKNVCEEELVLNDCNLAEDLSGAIFSPEYPLSVSINALGTYKLKIVSCDDTKIKLNINAANFDLGFGLNTFSVGDGINFGDNQILPELKSDYDGNSLPDNKPIQEYASTGNELWIIANLPDGNCKFVVNYVVIVPARDVIYLNETKGFFYSPDFNGTNYPSELEQQYLIDVSGESGDYVDLLFTVEEFDLNGARGDYVKLSQGTDVSAQKDAAVFTWKLPKGYQFLIDGPKANFVFEFMVPVDGDTSVHSGYNISYQAIEKNLTTPSPITTPAPTSPTPLPFDPEVLETSLVFLDYVSNSSACRNLIVVLEKYAASTNMLSEGVIMPELSESVIDITKREACYSGWNVNMTTCVWTAVKVETFYYKNDSKSVSYAFPRETVEEAVRLYGYPQGIVLPDSLVDFYWVSVVTAVCIIGIILIVLLISWRAKIRRHHNRRKEYLRGSGSSFGPGDGFDKSADNYVAGYVNNSFVYDEDDDHYGGPTYDPDRLKRYNRSNHHSNHYGTTSAVSRSQSLKQSSEPVSTERSNSLKWKVSSPDSSPRSSVETNNNTSTVQVPQLANVPKRGILKTSSSDNAPEQGPSIVTLLDEPDDEILFDNHSFKTPRQPAQPAVPLQSVPVMNAQRYGHSFEQQDLHGVVLDGYNSDDEKETNL